MILSVAKVLPGGNPTLLVEHGDVPDALRASVANYLIRDDVLGGEQVGFLTEPIHADLRLEMMDSEFCVNALRSAATLACQQSNKEGVLSVETDGYSRELQCDVSKRGDAYYCSIAFSARAKVQRLSDDLALTVLDRIAHFTVRVDRLPNRAESELLARHFRSYSAVSHIPCIGFIPFVFTGAEVEIAPLVYTRATDTNIHETACGSGSAAVAMHLSKTESNPTYRIKQPSGVFYQVIIETAGDETSVRLGSQVSVISKDDISIPSKVLAAA